MVKFVYNALELQLPSPRLNDTESLELNFHMDRSMNGTIYAFRKQSVPQERLSIFFEHTNRPKVIEVIAFLKASMGQFVQYTDYNGVVWTGKILTQPFTATHASIRNNTFNLEFEGTKNA